MVDRIENNIVSSYNYVEKAVENTAAAVVSQKKARKVCNINQHWCLSAFKMISISKIIVVIWLFLFFL